MICAVIKGPSKEEIKAQLELAKLDADLIELRIDHFDAIDLDFLLELRTLFFIPMIFTLRSQSQGGNYKKTESERRKEIEDLANLEPEYFDLESDLPETFIQNIKHNHPKIKIILSYHNFKETPDLEKIYNQMAQIKADYYKIAVMAHSSLDTLRLLKWVREKDNVIALAMGAEGEISRILAPIYGIPWTYAFIEQKQQTAEGQASVQLLRDRYNYHHLSPKTAVYALIGDPVDLSISDITHNQLFNYCSWDAIYIKIKIKIAEVKEFVKLAKNLNIKGISITMPLKEVIIPYLDEVEKDGKEIGAINTLILEKGVYKGFNTDGKGVIEAIEHVKPLLGMEISIIGAGGAAKAIAFEAINKGAMVTIINRDKDKAIQISKKWDCKALGLEEAKTMGITYDLLINSTPLDTPDLIPFIQPHKILMEVKTRPKETLFLREGAKKECVLIYGYQMFVGQAIGQFKRWFSNKTFCEDWEAWFEEQVIKLLTTETEKVS